MHGFVLVTMRVLNSYELIINYDYISSVDADCEGALSYGLSAANIVRQMLSKAAECAGEYLNLSGIEGLISMGEKKIRRLENYQYEFGLFAKKMSDLEESMSTDLIAVMRTTGDETTADECMETVVSDSGQRVQEMEDRSENFDDRLEDILSRPANASSSVISSERSFSFFATENPPF